MSGAMKKRKAGTKNAASSRMGKENVA